MLSCCCCPPPESLAWRAKVGADDALRRPMPHDLITLIRECRPSSYIGFDREVRPAGKSEKPLAAALVAGGGLQTQGDSAGVAAQQLHRV